MQVRVKTLTGKEVEIDIEPKDKVNYILNFVHMQIISEQVS